MAYRYAVSVVTEEVTILQNAFHFLVVLFSFLRRAEVGSGEEHQEEEHRRENSTGDKK